MRSRWWVWSLGAALLLPALPVAAADDPMHSAPCRRALQDLSAAEADRAASAPLKVARQRAATACLGPAAGQGASAPRAAGTAPTPGVPVGRVASPHAAQVDPAPRQVPRAPVTITGCDTSGCWASDGSRLHKQGPVLLGPRGVCTQTAGVLVCP